MMFYHLIEPTLSTVSQLFIHIDVMGLQQFTSNFAGSKKTYIFRKKKEKKERADCVCSGIFIHNPILLLDSN